MHNYFSITTIVDAIDLRCDKETDIFPGCNLSKSDAVFPGKINQ